MLVSPPLHALNVEVGNPRVFSRLTKITSLCFECRTADPRRKARGAEGASVPVQLDSSPPGPADTQTAVERLQQPQMLADPLDLATLKGYSGTLSQHI